MERAPVGSAISSGNGLTWFPTSFFSFFSFFDLPEKRPRGPKHEVGTTHDGWIQDGSMHAGWTQTAKREVKVGEHYVPIFPHKNIFWLKGCLVHNFHGEITLCATQLGKIYASDIATAQLLQQPKVPQIQDPISSSDSLDGFPSRVVCFVRFINAAAQAATSALVAYITARATPIHAALSAFDKISPVTSFANSTRFRKATFSIANFSRGRAVFNSTTSRSFLFLITSPFRYRPVGAPL
nr:hypothetical protein Iba_chr11fCG0850 [Ipomoea batatas]